MFKRFKSVFLSVIVLILLVGCDIPYMQVKYVPFVGEFGPNESCSKYFYYREYIRTESADYFALVRYDVDIMEAQEIYTTENADDQRIEDFYGDDEGVFYVFLENKNKEGYIEYSLIYHDNISDQNQIITCSKDGTFIIKTYNGPIIMKGDKYYSVEKENEGYVLVETTIPVEEQTSRGERKLYIKTEGGDIAVISKVFEDPNYAYQIGDKTGSIDALNGKYALETELSDNYVVEDGKVIGVVQSTSLKYKYYEGYDNVIKPGQLKGEALYEFDLETCESRILYEVKGNKKQIIGYKDGYVYIYKKGKIIKHSLETRKEEIIYKIDNLPEGRFSFNWVGSTLVIYNKTDWEVIGCVKVEN